jgi:GTP-dependent dephospho-CoA kinase
LVRAFKLPEEYREALSKPLGRLFTPKEVAGPEFAMTAPQGRTVVTVGDRVTETFGSIGRIPEVQIVDSKENRKPRRAPSLPHATLLGAPNPPGTITLEAVEAIAKAFGSKKPARVLVDGEEDLLAIPAVAYAPVGGAVYYGQPSEGIVMIEVTAEAKERNMRFLKEMGLPGP